jgi:aminoglycoside phosphotransferase (APT) family kinase protein
MRQVAALGIPMCLPLEFGTCAEGVYAVHSWIEGEELEGILDSMDEETRYRYGLDAGRILAKIHSIQAPADTPDWESRFNAKIDRKIAMYEACPLRYAGGEAFLKFLRENRHLLKNRPQTYQHGDYHVGNMMLEAGKLVIIDFDRDDFGDPWEEFNRIVWCAQAAPGFASGMVDGYFNGEVPMEFWRLLALYICSNTVGSLPWAIPYGEEEVKTMRAQAAEILRWYDYMQTVIPGWYRKAE